MSIFEYNEAEHMAMEREEWLQEGLKKGRAELVERVMVSSRLSFEEACSLLKLTEEEISDCRSYLNSAES